MEIERRFLVKDTNKIRELILEFSNTKRTITQDYVYSDKLTAIRKRKVEKSGDIKYIYTIKTGAKGYSVNEIENEISEDVYNQINTDSNRVRIIKDRYIIPYIDDLVIELDIFHGEYEGLVFAEIEFKTEEDAKNTSMPNWFYKEIGKYVTNDKLSRRAVNISELVK